MEKKMSQKSKKTAFNKPRLLIIGCGDVGLRILPMLCQRFRVFAVIHGVTHTAMRCAALRAAGAIPIVADLDQPHSLPRLAGLAQWIIHLVPPAPDGLTDSRTRHLLANLPRGPGRTRLVYVSTTGVYGDCGGALVDETRTVQPHNARAKRRVDAERALRAWGRRSHACVSILRVPGIYAGDRLPLARLRQGTPALVADEDVYTNHIHADDLARIIVAALCRGLPGRVYHAVDDSDLRMGEYFDAVADACGVPHPPRLTREALQQVVSPMMLSFMSESRRLGNARIKSELGVRLRYRRVQDGLDGRDALKPVNPVNPLGIE
jgi:nucleoside-diphosphate-sugar epimerase